MKYKAVVHPSPYHQGNRWLVVDENYKTVSKHISYQSAELEAARLNALEKEGVQRETI